MSKGNIYAISDIHVDQSENLTWVQQLSNDQYMNDTIIIPGDITHVLSKLFSTLKLFQSKFRDVYYCPGNHELWTNGQREDETLNISNSIDKFHYILKVCQDMGIHTTPGVHADCVTICPLYGWYDDSLHIPTAGLDSDLNLWTDHFMCQWTSEVPQHEAAKYFVQLNEENLSILTKNNSPSMTITFSHFFTSRRLMEAYRNELHRRREEQRQHSTIKPSENEFPGALIPNFSLVAGTQLLNDQLQRIKPRVHIFGHSHRKMTLNIGDGTEYVNNPLGYVRERQTGLIAPPHELYRIDWQTLINKPE